MMISYISFQWKGKKKKTKKKKKKNENKKQRILGSRVLLYSDQKND